MSSSGEGDGGSASARRIAELEARVAWLETVIEAVPEPVFVKDEDRRFVLVNQRCADFVGRSVDEMLGQTDADFFPSDEVAWFWQRDDAVLASGEVDEQIERLSDAEGRSHVVSTRKARAQLPDCRLLVGTIRDMTEAVARAARSEAELRSTLKVLEQLTALMPVGVVHLDGEGRFVYAFGPDLRAMGVTAEKIAGTPYQQLAPLWPELVPLLASALEGESSAAVLEWRGRARHVTAAPSLNEHGQPGGATLISIDHTDQLDAQRRTARSVRMDSLGRLAGGVAHELNNLLSIVMMGTSVLRDALAVGETSTALGQVRLLERSIERGSRMSRQLASFARRQVGLPTVVDLHDHLRPVQVFLESLVDSSVELVFSLTDKDTRVRLLPGQLEQLLINLVLHAAAGSAEGHVTVETDCVQVDEDPELRPGDYVVLRVRDRAPALPSAAREHLFEPFYDPDGRGSNMGLATCYGIAVQSGGRVRAFASDDGNVTEVLLPRTDDGPETKPELPYVRAAARRGLRVVLVEDEATLREQLRQLLDTAGHKVVLAAADGQEALDWLEDNLQGVDIVLSDIIMPHLSGIDLALALEGKVPIVLMSGFVADSLNKVADLGARFKLLMKPVRPDQLLHALQNELAERDGG